ncbi:MAG TPA: hypothetical protein VKD23_03675, partial [Terriglobales bacterium]|nr:hypothetical protein [Terriglobales bacterium]
MNCKQIDELLPDLAAGMDASTPEVEIHIASCNDCAAHLRDLQKTMALLDEWQAPEPSPYFDTRLRARLREEMARPAAGWVSWMRRPAWAMFLAAVVFAGALAIGIGGKSYLFVAEGIPTRPPTLGPPVQPGTAVGDLQALERNDELYADFDVLDDL